MNKARPFRFGISSHGAPTREAWVALARKVEDQGYSSLVMSDHLHVQMGVIPALVAAADATTTLRLGSFMFANDFRHPVFLAQDAATIDVLSGGRFELGLGTGWLMADYEKTGIPFDSPTVRVARMEEAVTVLKGCWTDSPFTFSGTYYTVKDLNGITQPHQKPRPPIMIGGGTKRILSFAAREADIVGINFRSTRDGKADLESLRPAAFEERVQWVCTAAGDRFESLELNSFSFIAAVTDQRRQVAEKGLQSFGIAVNETEIDDWSMSPVMSVGTVDQIVDDLRMRREKLGISYIVLRESVADAFAPIVARLTGT